MEVEGVGRIYAQIEFHLFRDPEDPANGQIFFLVPEAANPAQVVIHIAEIETGGGGKCRRIQELGGVERDIARTCYQIRRDTLNRASPLRVTDRAQTAYAACDRQWQARIVLDESIDLPARNHSI